MLPATNGLIGGRREAEVHARGIYFDRVVHHNEAGATMKKILVVMAVLGMALSAEATKAQANSTTGAGGNIAAGSAQLLAGPPGTSCSPGVTLAASPNATLDDLFQSYGNSGTGTSWTGGDGTVSVALPDGRELWFFADSLLGTVTNGQRPFSTTAFLHNSLVVENNGSLTKTYFTSASNAWGATSFLNPRPRNPWMYAFWPTAAVVNGTTVQVLGTERIFARAKYGTEKPIPGVYMATLGLPSLDLLGIRKLPSRVVAGDQYIFGTLAESGYTYIYVGSAKGVDVARVVGTDLRSPWTYYDGNGWSSKLSKAVAVEPNLTQVTAIGGIYLFITAIPVSSEIVAAVACSPVGPFGPSQAIYTMPESSSYPTSYGGISTYDAKLHPELDTSPNTLVASYDVNFWAIHALVNPDASVYRPRFIDITVNPG